MKKALLIMALVVAMGGPAFAESPIEKTVDVAVQGTKNVLGLVLKGVHVVFHGAETIIGVGIDLTHSGLKVLEIPFSNGKPLVDEA